MVSQLSMDQLPVVTPPHAFSQCLFFFLRSPATSDRPYQLQAFICQCVTGLKMIYRVVKPFRVTYLVLICEMLTMYEETRKGCLCATGVIVIKSCREMA
jgi:hypothetical protein